jgi:hypothetical protein
VAAWNELIIRREIPRRLRARHANTVALMATQPVKARSAGRTSAVGTTAELQAQHRQAR